MCSSVCFEHMSAMAALMSRVILLFCALHLRKLPWRNVSLYDPDHTYTYLRTNLLTCLLTHCLEQSLLETLTCSELVKNFPEFYGTRKFITAFASALHLSLS